MAKNQIISVVFQGAEIGKIGYDADQRKSFFQYHSDFLISNQYKKIFPYVIRRTPNVQVFSEFEGETFRGLPPMIADSLPDVFGNLIFKEWLEFTQKEAVNITPLEQLTYVGKRGMGALEFMPSQAITTATEINIDEISQVVKKVLDVKSSIHEKNISDLALRNIFKIGTSAGGARPKILISEHKHT